MTIRPFAVAIVSIAVLSCSSSSAPRTRPAQVAAVGPDVLATVNGVAITQADVELATSSGPSPHGGAAPRPQDMLNHIVRQEVLAQRAVAAHLDRNEQFQQELAGRQAQLAAWTRDHLSELYQEREASRRPQISEADARRYYDQNTTRIRTETRIGQILYRDEARIQQALSDLRAGRSFDEVAAGRYPSVPDLANKPWEIDYLRWNQLPEQWRPVIDGIAVGQTSDVIRGTNNRFWIIKVLGRRENPELTFEATRPIITQMLQQERRVEALSHLDEDALRSARVVYLRPPHAAPAPAPTPE